MFTLVCLLLVIILLPMALRAMAELSLWAIGGVILVIAFLVVKGFLS